MGSRLTADALRALKIIAERPVHELQEQPFASVEYLVHLGYADRTPFTSRRRSGKIDQCWEVRITPAGVAALEAEASK